ncbi:anti-CBASS protein Acb1 family protein, partial [Lactobacillus paragasseri]
MAKKKTRHFKTPVVRSDSLDLSPTVDYESIAWKTAAHSQDYEALDDRYKYDAIAHKMVSKAAKDATRNGFRLVIPGKPD